MPPELFDAETEDVLRMRIVELGIPWWQFVRSEEYAAWLATHPLAASVWDETKHPRHPAGSELGGEFAAKVTVDYAPARVTFDDWAAGMEQWYTEKEGFPPDYFEQNKADLWRQYEESVTKGGAELRNRLALTGVDGVRMRPELSSAAGGDLDALMDPERTHAPDFDVSMPADPAAHPDDRPGFTVWTFEDGTIQVEDIIDIGDTAYFPGGPESETAMNYTKLIDAARGQTAADDSPITIYRGMSDREINAWDAGEEIPAGKFFTNQPTASYAQDIPGEPPTLQTFSVPRSLLIEVAPGEFQLRQKARMRNGKIEALTAAYDETKHPRYVKGTKTAGKVKGGRFSPKGTAAQKDGTPEDEQAKPKEQGTDIVTVLDQAALKQTLAKANEPPPAAFEWPPPLPETDKALGLNGATDVRELPHVMVNGLYTPERLALHDDIVGKFLAQSGMVKQEHPTALFMAGGSGAGKSSILGTQLTDGSGRFEGGIMEDIPENAVYVNPDNIKELLPEYQKMIDAGDPAAASFVHEESSTIAKELLSDAYERGYNVVVDGTGDSGVGKFYEKVQKAEATGRSTRVVMVDIPTEMAVARAKERAKGSGRMVPVSEIRLVHKNVAANFAQWHAQVDDWELWDNHRDHDPRLVAKRKPG